MRFTLLLALALGGIPGISQDGFEPLVAERCDWELCRRWPDHEPEGRVKRHAPGPRELAGLLGSAHQLRTVRFGDFPGMDADTTRSFLEAELHTPVRFSAEARSLVAVEGETLALQLYGLTDQSAKHILDELTQAGSDRRPVSWIAADRGITFVTATEYEESVRAIETSAVAEELAALRKRVFVHWDAVRLHDLRHERARTGLPMLVVAGRLDIQVEGSEQLVPLTWQLGVRVLIERVPGTRPRWDAGYSGENTLCVDTLVNDDGSFAVHFDPAELRRPPDETHGYQVALCLPDMEPGGIWREVTRPLPRGNSTMDIPGPESLSATLQLINASPLPEAERFDPAALVRAVNHLHGLGKEKAIEALKQYVALAPDRPPWSERGPGPESLDSADAARAFFIVHLLFEPSEGRHEPGSGWDRIQLEEDLEVVVNPRQSYRPLIFWGLMAAGLLDGNEYADPSAYPAGMYPFVVIDDLPFFMPSWLGGRSGGNSNALAHVVWAEKHGRLRERPLRPPDDPLRALDELLSLPGLPRPHNDPRLQVWYAVAEAIGIPVELSTDLFRDELRDDDPNWMQVVAAAGGRSLRWDETKQAYVRAR